MSAPLRAVANFIKWQTENSANLGAAGFVVGVKYEISTDQPFTEQAASGDDTASARFRVFATSDQTGTVFIEQSVDGNSWYVTKTQATTATTPGNTTGSVAAVGTVPILEDLVTLPYVRARFVNGATPQTRFVFATALVGV